MNRVTNWERKQSARSTGTRFRAGAVLSLGAMTLHHLRYELAYPDHSGEALATQGHGYLKFVSAAVLCLVVLACVGLLLQIVRPCGEVAPTRTGLGRTWITASGALVSIYAVQELLEGMLVHGHPAGLGALTAHGGWVALLLGAVLGGAVTLLLRGSATVVRITAGRGRPRFHRPAPAPGAPACGSLVPALSPVPRFPTGRGPPLVRP